jgi:hypothetical protein
LSNHGSTGRSGQRRVGPRLVLLGIVLTVAVGLFWFALKAAETPDLEPIPFTDVNPFGANFFLAREVEHWKQEKTLEMAREAGIGWIKQHFSWEEIEPLAKGEFDWVKYDRIVDLAEGHGMHVIARLDRPPDWTRQDDTFKTRPPDDLDDYGDFVYAFVDRYRGRVRYIQIWNEPNLTAEWGFRRVDAVAYTRLLEVAYRRAKEADPNVVVLSAPLAITLEDASMRGNHNDLIFLEQMYQTGAGEYFDILSVNAFGLDLPPEDPPDPNVLNFRRTELHRALMEKYGDADKPLWINEYGWNAAPASFADELLTWERVTEEQQAEYTVRGIEWARENWPWLGVVNLWYFRQVGDVPPERAAYYFGLVDPEFSPSLVYDAVRQAAQGIDTASIGMHQETSPALEERGWRLVLDPEASAGAALVGDAASGPLTFAFEGRQVELVTRQGPDQGSLVVRVDGVPPAGLRLDDQGRASIDLRADGSRQTTVTLARSLGDGTHTLTLEPAAKGRVTVDALVVSERGSELLVYLLWGLCGLLILVGVALWLLGSYS